MSISQEDKDFINQLPIQEEKLELSLTEKSILFLIKLILLSGFVFGSWIQLKELSLLNSLYIIFPSLIFFENSIRIYSNKVAQELIIKHKFDNLFSYTKEQFTKLSYVQQQIEEKYLQTSPQEKELKSIDFNNYGESVHNLLKQVEIFLLVAQSFFMILWVIAILQLFPTVSNSLTYCAILMTLALSISYLYYQFERISKIENNVEAVMLIIEEKP